MTRIGSSLSPKLQLSISIHILLDSKTQIYSELCVAFYFTHPSYYIAIKKKKSLVHSVWFAIWYDCIGYLSAMMWHLHWRKARNHLGWPSISDSRLGCFQLILHLRNSFDLIIVICCNCTLSFRIWTSLFLFSSYLHFKNIYCNLHLNYLLNIVLCMCNFVSSPKEILRETSWSIFLFLGKFINEGITWAKFEANSSMHDTEWFIRVILAID